MQQEINLIFARNFIYNGLLTPTKKKYKMSASHDDIHELALSWFLGGWAQSRPPRSSDLNLLDFNVWGHMNDLV
jgi:hypothetical protein